MSDKELTLYDRIVRWYKNQPVIVVVLVLLAVVVGVRAFTEALDGLIPLGGQPSTERGNQRPTPAAADPGATFVEASVLPAGYSLVFPGLRLSLAKATYPSGVISHVHGEPFFEVTIVVGPFSQALYYFEQSDSEVDPKIAFVTFLLRDGEISERVGREALQRYGSAQAKSFVDGRLVWEDMDGLRIVFMPAKYLEYSLARWNVCVPRVAQQPVEADGPPLTRSVRRRRLHRPAPGVGRTR